MFIVDPKHCASEPERAFGEVLSGFTWRQLQIILTVFTKRFRYIAEQRAEGRGVIEGVSRQENKLPATLRVEFNLNGE